MRIKGDHALAGRGFDPLYVFFDPAAIGLIGEGGKNLGNESLIFHEALHGWTSLTDDQLKARLNIGGRTCGVTVHIQIAVMDFAPNLDSYVAWDCDPIP